MIATGWVLGFYLAAEFLGNYFLCMLYAIFADVAILACYENLHFISAAATKGTM